MRTLWPRKIIALLSACGLLGTAAGLVAAPRRRPPGAAGRTRGATPPMTPDERAGLLLGAMTQDEKVALLGGDELTGVAGGEHAHTGRGAGVAAARPPDGPLLRRPGRPAPGQVHRAADPAGAGGDVRPRAGRRARRASPRRGEGEGQRRDLRPDGQHRTQAARGPDLRELRGGPVAQSQLVVPWIRARRRRASSPTSSTSRPTTRRASTPPPAGSRRRPPLGAGRRGQPPTFRTTSSTSGRCARSTCRTSRPRSSDAKRRHRHVRLQPHQRPVRLRERAPARSRSCARSGASTATCWPTTAPRTTPSRSLNNGLDFEPFPPSPTSRSPSARARRRAGQHADARRPRPRDAAHVVPLRALRPRRLQGRRRADRQARRTRGPRSRSRSRRSRCCRTEAACCRSTPSKLKAIAVIGAPATTFVTGGGSGNVAPFDFAAPLDAIKAARRLRRGGQLRRRQRRRGRRRARARTPTSRSSSPATTTPRAPTARACRCECPMVHGDQDALIARRRRRERADGRRARVRRPRA